MHPTLYPNVPPQWSPAPPPPPIGPIPLPSDIMPAPITVLPQATPWTTGPSSVLNAFATPITAPVWTPPPSSAHSAHPRHIPAFPSDADTFGTVTEADAEASAVAQQEDSFTASAATEQAATTPGSTVPGSLVAAREPDLSGKFVQYSDMPALLNRQMVQTVSVLVDPHSFTALPMADIQLTNGARYKMMLPRETEEFRQLLDRAGVPYAFRRNEKEGIRKTLDTLGATAKELFVPFLLLAASGASAAYAMKRYQRSQQDSEIVEAINAAHKDLSGYPFEYATTLRDQAPHVRKSLNSFLNKELDVLVAKGLPGIGKTHVFLSLAKEIQKRDSSIFVLEIRPGKAGDSVRDLLKDMYSGDKSLAAKAAKFLTKENDGQPVKELLLYADEVEKLPGDLMERLLVNGIQNPDSTVPGLPKLRMLGTCNSWPAFINNSATESRVASTLITPPSPQVIAGIFADTLSARLSKPIDKQAVAEAVLPVFQEYEGYSPRTITQSVVKKVTNSAQGTPGEQAQAAPETRDSLNGLSSEYQVVEKSAVEKVAEAVEQGTPLQPELLARILEEQLQSTPLKNTEMAALIVNTVARSVMSGPKRLDPVNGPDNLWRSLQDDAEKTTKGLNQYVNMNGKQAKATILRHLKKYSLDYSADPQALSRAVTGVGDDLKTERLAALRDTDPFLHATSELADFTTDFLERTVAKAKQEAQQAGRPLEPVVLKLEAVARNLQHLDLSSDAGQKFLKAAGTYQELRKVNDPNDPTFMDNQKLDAVIRRALNYSPALHTRENDFKLIADPLYASLFIYLRDALQALGDEQ